MDVPLVEAAEALIKATETGDDVAPAKDTLQREIVRARAAHELERLEAEQARLQTRLEQLRESADAHRALAGAPKPARRGRRRTHEATPATPGI